MSKDDLQAPRVDGLGEFLTAYDEYLDGKRSYADLPVLPAAIEHEPLHFALRRYAIACAHDDRRMTPSPWRFDDRNTEIRTTKGDRSVVTGGSVGWTNAMLNIDDDDAAAIVSSRNRLPEMTRVLQDAAKRVDILENLAIQHGAARDRLRDRVEALEGAIRHACEAIVGAPGRATEVLISLRAALAQEPPA